MLWDTTKGKVLAKQQQDESTYKC